VEQEPTVDEYKIFNFSTILVRNSLICVIQ
jgi:hypothetical protein